MLTLIKGLIMFNETRVYGGITYKRIPRDIWQRMGAHSNPLLKHTKQNARTMFYWVQV